MSDLTPSAPQGRTEGAYYPWADAYWKAGWHNVFPLLGKDQDIPSGLTGRGGRLLLRSDVATFMVSNPNHNLAVRLDGVVGIDVDHYLKGGVQKRGAVTLTLAQQRWGPLPPTWRSSARSDGISGIYFYRVPPGYLGLVSQLKLADDNGEMFGDIEVVQYHHRYALVWPSTNPDAGGATYRWYDPAGNVAIGIIPEVDGLPWLPQTFLDGLTELGTQDDPTLARDAVPVAPQRAQRAEWHPKVEEHFVGGVQGIMDAPGSRHDNVGYAVGQLARDEDLQRAGATTALEELGTAFTVHLGAERDAASEFQRMLVWSRSQVAETASRLDRERRLVQAVFANVPRYTTSVEGVAATDLLPPPVEVETEATPNVWTPVDISIYWDPDWRPEPPTFLERTDGRCLWYRGNVNWLHGESGSGKTWVALIAVAQEILAGRHVTWVHYEDPLADKLAYRLRLLGITRDQAVEFFHVVVVQGASMLKGIPYLRPINQQYGSEVVVIDSIGEAIGSDGIPVKDDERFLPWIHQTLRVLAADGLTVLCIDHVPMGDPERLDPIGSFRKKAATTGAMFLAVIGRAFSQAEAGWLKLVCAKDRSGVWALEETVAIIKLSPRDERMEWVIEPPKNEEDSSGIAEPEMVVIARHAYRALEANGGPMKKSGLMARLAVTVKARDSVKRNAVDLAIEWGWIVETKEGTAKLLQIGIAPPDPKDLLDEM